MASRYTEERMEANLQGLRGLARALALTLGSRARWRQGETWQAVCNPEPLQGPQALYRRWHA